MAGEIIKIEGLKGDLSKFKFRLPPNARSAVLKWVKRYDAEVVVTGHRATKYGDYRPPMKDQRHKITINGDLNKYMFLVILVHELAHLIVWNKFRRRAKPHGREWRASFSYLLNYLISIDSFPQELAHKMEKYVKELKSRDSCTDMELSRILKPWDKSGSLHVENLTEGTAFTYNRRMFIKGPLLRSRFRCREAGTRKFYLFSPVTEVKRIRRTTLTKRVSGNYRRRVS